MDVAAVHERPLPALVGDAHAGDGAAVRRDVELHVRRHLAGHQALDQIDVIVLAPAQPAEESIRVFAAAADHEGRGARGTHGAAHDRLAGRTDMALDRSAERVVVPAPPSAGARQRDDLAVGDGNAELDGLGADVMLLVGVGDQRGVRRRDPYLGIGRHLDGRRERALAAGRGVGVETGAGAALQQVGEGAEGVGAARQPGPQGAVRRRGRAEA